MKKPKSLLLLDASQEEIYVQRTIGNNGFLRIRLTHQSPAAIAKALLVDGQTRFKVKLNGSIEWSAALLSMGNNIRYLLMNRERSKKARLKEGSAVEIELKVDDSKYGIELPEEMEELLKQDEVGSKHFHALTIGKQRSLLHLAGKPKRSATRLNKAITILEYLKRSNGNLDFRELNEAFKLNAGH